MSTENKNDDLEIFFKIADSKLQSSLREGVIFAQKQKQSLISKFAAADILGSGRTFLYVTEIFQNQVKITARTILDTLSEVYQGFVFDIDDKITEKIIDFALHSLETNKKALLEEMLASTPFKQSGFMKEDQLKKITDGQVAEFEKSFLHEFELLDAKLNLLIRTIKMSKFKTQISGATVNVAGNVQNIQIGDNNIIINEGNKTAIVDSFNEIRQTLKDSDLIEATKYQEIDALMTDCEQELQKAEPNKTKIGACLGAIGKTISGISTLGGAYQALKMFSPLFGGPPLP